MMVLTPIKAIRAKCMDCTCNQPKEIRECRITLCAVALPDGKTTESR